MSNATSEAAKDTYFKEFPFLGGGEMWLDSSSVNNIRIERLDTDVLDIVPNQPHGRYLDQRFVWAYLVNQMGIASEVPGNRWVKETKRWKKFFGDFWGGPGSDKYEKGISIKTAIEKLGDLQRELSFVVAVFGDIPRRGGIWYDVTVYKVAKDFSLSAFIAEKQGEVREQIREQLAE
jgi:hypothetical protein